MPSKRSAVKWTGNRVGQNRHLNDRVCAHRPRASSWEYGRFGVMIRASEVERTDSMRRRAFTLIELLVVIAVIAVLMAILMPALQRAKDQAQRVHCVSNTKTLVLGWLLYKDDYDGRIVGGHTDPGNWVLQGGLYRYLGRQEEGHPRWTPVQVRRQRDRHLSLPGRPKKGKLARYRWRIGRSPSPAGPTARTASLGIQQS